MARRSSKSPINSRKHFRNDTPFQVGAASISRRVIAVANEDPGTTANAVAEGCVIKAVYVELWITSDDATASSFVVTLEKSPGNGVFMSYANSIDLENYSNKKNILYTTEGLVGPNTQNAVPVIRQWFAIPKGKQRFGLDDRLYLNVSGISNGVDACGVYIYKEYR